MSHRRRAGNNERADRGTERTVTAIKEVAVGHVAGQGCAGRGAGDPRRVDSVAGHAAGVAQIEARGAGEGHGGRGAGDEVGVGGAAETALGTVEEVAVGSVAGESH